MELHILRFASLLLFTGAVQGETWSLRKSNAKFEFANITGPKNDTIISKTFIASSRLECASACHSMNRISGYYQLNGNICSCNKGTDDAMVSTTEDSDIGYIQMTNSFKFFEFETYQKIQVEPVPTDCLNYYNLGYRQDGVYRIQPEGGDKVDTWCDMVNGGWSVIQRRQDGSEDFYRTFVEYENGFGNRSGEYWLGLENIHLLTLNASTLHIDMETFGDKTPISAYAEYSTFQIGSSATYNLHVGGYTGDCADSLIGRHNGRPFATKDDNYCAKKFMGAWWYGPGAQCHFSNLNGYYQGGSHAAQGVGVNWLHCWGYNYSLKSTVMKIKRNV